MRKGKFIYRVKIECFDDGQKFQVTWFKGGREKWRSFKAAAPDFVAKGKNGTDLWISKQHALETGEMISQFLDGDAACLQRALMDARRGGFPLKLLINACLEASDWPFEFLADNGAFLLSQDVLLARIVSDYGEDSEMSVPKRPLELLFMACSALDVQPELDFEKEEESILEVTEKLPVDVDVEDSGSLEGLRAQLERQQYDVVHLSGHADIKDSQPFFIMEDEKGRRKDVSPEQLWRDAFRGNSPRLLFLSGCRTGETPISAAGATNSFARMLVERYNIPAVLGWGRPVNDDEATVAMQEIFKMLTLGKSILEAVQRARLQLMEEFDSSNPAWPLLRLFCNGIEPGAIVRAEREYMPKLRRRKHVFLKRGRVRILEEGFVGRRRQLQQSLGILNDDQHKVGLLLLGAGGLGKSCLAGKIIERFEDHTLIIIHGELNDQSMKDALDDAFLVSQDESGKKKLNSKKSMPEILENLCATSFSEKKYLILMDDFEQNLEGASGSIPGHLTSEAARLLEVLLYHLPVCLKQTQLLITSRYRFTLTRRNRDLVEEFLEPVFLTSFGEAEIRKKARTLKHVLSYARHLAFPLLLEAGYGNPLLMDRLNELAHTKTITESFKLIEAFKAIRQEFTRELMLQELVQQASTELTQLIKALCVYREPVRIRGVEVIAEKIGLKDWRRVLKNAVGISLVEYDRARVSYRVTPLLQEELYKTVEETGSLHEVCFNYYKDLCTGEPRKAFEPIVTKEWIFHALRCGEIETASRKGGDLVKYLRIRHSFKDAKKVGLWILEENERIDRKFATASDAFLLNELALTLNSLGDHSAAAQYCEFALNIDKNRLGADHEMIAIYLNNLGTIWQSMKKPGKAIRYYEDALKINKTNHNRGYLDVGMVLSNLGTAWSEMGDYDKAIGFYGDAREILEGKQKRYSNNIAITLNNLGEAWRQKNDLNKAMRYIKEALQIWEENQGNESPYVASGLFSLGEVYVKINQKSNAKACFEKSYKILSNIFGEEHSKSAIAAKRLKELG